MSINARIRDLRKSLGMNQKAFGTALGLGQGAVSWIEQEGNTVTDQNIKTICSKFNISEEWLRTGDGKMESASATDEFAAFAERHHLTPAETEVMRYCFFLPADDRAALLRHITNLADTIHAAESADESADAPVSDTVTSPQRNTPMTAEEIEKEVDAYRTALIAEQKGQPASSSGSSAAKMA